jgi:hypothetical protein
MAQYDATITTLVTGDDFDVDILVSDVPSPLTKAWFTVKKYAADLDVAAVLQTSITPVASSAGQITISGIYTRCLFTLTAAQTRLLNRNAQYYYDMQVMTSGLKIATIEKGLLTPVGDITITTS